MTVASYTGEINTNGEWATIASLTSFTFVEDTPYWIQVQNIAEIKIASAEFTVHNEKFKYTQLEDDIYIKTNERVVLTILETTENSGGGGGGSTPGNGKIIINQGGTKKGEFTVNQSGNTTIDLDAGSGITVDNELSNSSENPVQNKVIYSALGDKLDASDYVVDSALSSSSENPVQNKIIYNTFINNFTINTTNYDTLIDSTTTGFGYWPSKNGYLTFFNNGSSTVKAGAIVANSHVGSIPQVPSTGCTSVFCGKGQSMWVVRGSADVEIRFYPVDSGI